MEYSSTLQVESKISPGVRYRISRMSFGRRLELTRRVRELGGRVEFLQAGSDMKDRLEATVLSGEVERLYLEWGLAGVEGLMIDGEPATPESLLNAGPEPLAREVLDAIRAECGLSEEERKN
jgi:hypothetical protein